MNVAGEANPGRPVVARISRSLVAAGLLVTVLSIVSLAPWQQPTGATNHTHSEIAWANVNPIGTNTFIAHEVEIWKRERTMEMVAEMGAGWIRQGFHWNEIEPQKGEHWDARYQQDAWAKFDNIVDLAEQNGVRIIARLDQTPEWARPPGSDPATPPSNHEDFGDFVHDFVTRYQGRISFIQIWNEPNLAREWGGAIDPAGYASLLETAARRAREANPDIVILSAPMAMTTENSPRAADEFVYWQALYGHGAADWFDIMSANVFGLSDPYDAEPDMAVLNTRRVELLRELAVRNGDGDKAIWFNEYGWNASPVDFPEDELIWSRVDDITQAEWTAAGLAYAEEHWNWFGVANIWFFRQVGNMSPSSSEYYFRMVDVEFTPRDVYRSVQGYSEGIFVAGPGEHGPLEASVTSIGSWPIVRGEQFSDGHAIASNGPGRLEVRFSGSELILKVPPGSSSGTINVSIHQGTSASSRSTASTTYVLPADGGPLTISAGRMRHPSFSSPFEHVAVIQVEDGSTLTLDGIVVRYERNYAVVIAGAALIAAGLAGLVIGRLRTGVPA